MADTTKISRSEWLRYIERLRKINDKASDDIRRFVSKYDSVEDIDRNTLVDYAYGVATKYGEGAASLSAEMYEAVAMLEGKRVKPAEVADTPTYKEVAKTVNGIIKQSDNTNMLASGVGRLVKRTGIDTVMNNALRDGAEWAWIPSGDSCAFCIMLASQGWVKASRKAIKNGHAEHIHANCDCTYAVRFDSNLEVEGYNPAEYQRMYYGAEGKTPEEKINSMRRMFYAQNKGIVGPESSKAEEFIPSVSKAINKNGKEIEFDFPVSDKERLNNLRNEQKSILTSLSQEYNTNLEMVTSGAKQAAGDVDITGTIMRLSSKHSEDAIHEFAHTLANTDADKFGLTNNKDFWNEIRKVRTEYRKAVRDNPSKRISSYADAGNSLDEFMAEAFTQAIAKEKGIQLPDSYGGDYEYAEKVLQIINKYFKRK